MPVRPTSIRLDKGERVLVVEWSDGVKHRFTWPFLRSQCPSAGERNAREGSNPLEVLRSIPSSELVNVRGIGNYAINLIWADGHNAGIYTWEYLRELGSRTEAQAASPDR